RSPAAGLPGRCSSGLTRRRCWYPRGGERLGRTIRPTLRRWRDILERVTVEGTAATAAGAMALWTLCANAAYALQWSVLAAAAAFAAAGAAVLGARRALLP